MASLIRLKQIESGSSLQDAADIGADINTQVIGIVSSSLSGALSLITTDIEVAAISASIAASIGIVATGVGLVTTGSFNSYTQSVSQSFSASSAIHNEFSSSLNSVYATDYEVYITSSQIIDQGEF
jgi:hypothetical protein